jgi:hypothetical protein
MSATSTYVSTSAIDSHLHRRAVQRQRVGHAGVDRSVGEVPPAVLGLGTPRRVESHRMPGHQQGAFAPSSPIDESDGYAGLEPVQDNGCPLDVCLLSSCPRLLGDRARNWQEQGQQARGCGQVDPPRKGGGDGGSWQLNSPSVRASRQLTRSRRDAGRQVWDNRIRSPRASP